MLPEAFTRRRCSRRILRLIESASIDGVASVPYARARDADGFAASLRGHIPTSKWTFQLLVNENALLIRLAREHPRPGSRRCGKTYLFVFYHAGHSGFCGKMGTAGSLGYEPAGNHDTTLMLRGGYSRAAATSANMRASLTLPGRVRSGTFGCSRRRDR